MHDHSCTRDGRKLRSSHAGPPEAVAKYNLHYWTAKPSHLRGGQEWSMKASDEEKTVAVKQFKLTLEFLKYANCRTGEGKSNYTGVSRSLKIFVLYFAHGLVQNLSVWWLS